MMVLIEENVEMRAELDGDAPPRRQTSAPGSGVSKKTSRWASTALPPTDSLAGSHSWTYTHSRTADDDRTDSDSEPVSPGAARLDAAGLRFASPLRRCLRVALYTRAFGGHPARSRAWC